MRHWLPTADRSTLAWAAIVVLLSRLPWLFVSYGSDPDSYRVVGTARHLMHTGQYQASRLPGYPAYEYLTTLTASGPAWMSNAVTALFSVAAFIFFALILRQLQLRYWLLLALGFAMVPVIYVNSCCTIDYVPSLAAMLAATLATFRGRPVLAGLVLGLAIGFRITAGALALPLAVWMLSSSPLRVALPRLLKFGLATLLTSVLCYLPVYRVYGFGFFAFFDNDGYPPPDVVFGRAVPLVWGEIGAVALLLVLCASPLFYRYTRQALQQSTLRNALRVSVLAVVLFSIAFLRLPDEAGYLIPLVPWVLLLVAILTPPAIAVSLALALIVSPWIGFQAARPTWEGAILEDHQVRSSQQRQTHAIIDAVGTLPGRAAIVCGWVLPRITLALGSDRVGAHEFIYLIEDEGDYRHYLADGWQIYYLPGVDLYESQAHQLELADMGARQLDVPRERQRPKSSGE